MNWFKILHYITLCCILLGNTSQPGITYLTIKDLFKRTEELRDDRDFELMVTYIEVYNELVKDLLNPGPPLNLLEDAKFGMQVTDWFSALFTLFLRGSNIRGQSTKD